VPSQKQDSPRRPTTVDSEKELMFLGYAQYAVELPGINFVTNGLVS
jgi:hypothetical protein